MGRQSTKENKSVYQLFREELGYTREKASELMEGVSAARIEKIENGQDPTPYDIIQMADCYRRPELCNYFCAHRCKIGERYVPELSVPELPNIILETVASLNDLQPLTNRLIQIARDGKISDDEIPDFAQINHKLEHTLNAVNTLNLWVDKMISEHTINAELLKKEQAKLED